MIEHIILITVVSILFFWRTTKYNYCSDDVPVFNATKDKYKDCWWKRLFFEIEGSIRVNQKRDHIITIIMHTLVCVFIYIGFGKTNISFIAAFLFMFNPANNQGSIWIAGRGYVLPTLFLLLAMAIPCLSPIFLFLTTYFHTGFFTPLMFAVSPFRWYMLFMPVIWLLWYKRFRCLVKQKVDTEMFGEDKKIHPKKLILFFKTFGYYLTLVIIPFRLSFYHSYMQSMSGNDIMKKRAYKIDKFFFIGVSAFMLMSYVIFRNPSSYISLACAWWIFGIAPYCNLFRFHQEIAERYVYLPMVGISFILGTVLLDYPMFMAAFLSMYATRLFTYMPAYQDDYFLSEIACLNSRDAWFSWHIRAMKRWDAKSYREAIILWVMAKNISPHEFKVLYNIGTCLKVLRQDKEADEFYNFAKQHIPLGQEEQINKLYEDIKKGKASIIL